MKTILTAALAAFFAFPAWAEPICMMTPFLVPQIEAYHETVVSVETRPHGNLPEEDVVWEVWANIETGTWTLTARYDLFMCAVKTGQNYSGESVSDILKGVEGTAI